ncbi:MAG: DUF3168 domain-containing protein [Hyphomicrobiales bacterium]|nr:DUF3168 domain-containing protein [Hyphomicrobiales bacterium]
MGGPHVYDEPPRAAAGTNVVYGGVDARDWSSGDGVGCEQVIDLIVWAGKGRETSVALALAGRIGAVLHDAALSPAGHRIVNLRQTALEVKHDLKSGLSRATLRLRCITEQR